MNILKLIIITASLAIGFNSYSQTFIASQTSNNGVSVIGPSGTGQSFLVTSDDSITSISVLPLTNTTSVTLNIFDNATGVGNPIYTQTGISLMAAQQTDPLQTITLNTPVPVFANQNYLFSLEQAGNDNVRIYASNNNPYSAGDALEKLFSGSYFIATGFDLVFQISGTQKATPTTNAIPSSSVLSLLLILGLITGLVITRKSIFNKN